MNLEWVFQFLYISVIISLLSLICILFKEIASSNVLFAHVIALVTHSNFFLRNQFSWIFAKYNSIEKTHLYGILYMYMYVFISNIAAVLYVMNFQSKNHYYSTVLKSSCHNYSTLYKNVIVCSINNVYN